MAPKYPEYSSQEYGTDEGSEKLNYKQCRLDLRLLLSTLVGWV